MTEEELEKLKETISYFGHWYDVIGEERVLILEKSIRYIAELEAQIEKMKECANCPVWLFNQTEKNCKDCKNKEALILLRR